jgi:hypothetical protein
MQQKQKIGVPQKNKNKKLNGVPPRKYKLIQLENKKNLNGCDISYIMYYQQFMNKIIEQPRTVRNKSKQLGRR